MEIKGTLKSSSSLRLEHVTKQALDPVCTGCTIMDYSFHNIVRTEIGEIRFRNFYAALLTIKVRFKACAAVESRTMRRNSGSSSGTNSRWRTAVRARQLMPNPHLETGSQELFVLREKDFRHSLKDVAALRFVLQQPSPMWKDFRLEDVTFWRSTGLVNEANAAALRHLASLARPMSSGDRDVSESGDQDNSVSGGSLQHRQSSEVAAKLQQLWAMSAWCQANAPRARVGNYEKQGSYEGSLLAYS